MYRNMNRVQWITCIRFAHRRKSRLVWRVSNIRLISFLLHFIERRWIYVWIRYIGIILELFFFRADLLRVLLFFVLSYCSFMFYFVNSDAFYTIFNRSQELLSYFYMSLLSARIASQNWFLFVGWDHVHVFWPLFIRFMKFLHYFVSKNLDVFKCVGDARVNHMCIRKIIDRSNDRFNRLMSDEWIR